MRFIDTVIIYIALGMVIGLTFVQVLQDREMGDLQTKIERLEAECIDLQLQIGTNKLLLKETQRMVVPREIALKREIPAKQ